jgi:Omp85 superfamily domain
LCYDIFAILTDLISSFKTPYNKLNLKIIWILSIILFFIRTPQTFGQDSKLDSTSVVNDVSKQVDIKDFMRAIFTKKEVAESDSTKKSIAKEDSTKKKSLGPFYTPVVYPGYSLVSGFLVGVVNSLSFYTHRSDDSKISTISMLNMYTQNKQFLNMLQSNIWLNNEKYNLLGDFRYYNYPNFTYGLGSKTNLGDLSNVDYTLVRLYEVIMRQISKNSFVGLGYNLDSHTNISETNNPKNLDTDLKKYGYSNSSKSSGITANFQYDSRLNSNNPAEGAYANVQLRANLKALDSDNDWQSATIDLRYYVPLSRKSGNVLAFWTYNVFTLGGNPPYFDLPSTGWDVNNNTGRGYVEGRFRGTNALYFETVYRFNISKKRLLGGAIFSNIASFSEPITNKFDRINFAYGAGLRIKVNKFANTNLTIDYGIGQGGSKGFSFGLNENF